LRYFRHGKVSTVSILKNNPYLIAIISTVPDGAYD